MIRFAIVLAAGLLAAPAAFACGDIPCGDRCSMPATIEADDVDAAEGTKVTLAVSGLRCGRCADKVVAALRQLDGVAAVAVDHEAGQARVAFDAEKLDTARIIAAVAEAGSYEATEAR